MSISSIPSSRLIGRYTDASTAPNGADRYVSVDSKGRLILTDTSADALTDAELRASAVPISGTVAVSSVALAVTHEGKAATDVYTPLYHNTLTALTSGLVKVGQGNVFSMSVYNIHSTKLFIYAQLHDLAVAPTSTVSVPKFIVPLSYSTFAIIGTDYFTTEGMHFVNGIRMAFSTTRDVFTTVAFSDARGTVQYT